MDFFQILRSHYSSLKALSLRKTSMITLICQTIRQLSLWKAIWTMSLLLDGFENPIKPLKVLPYELGQETSNNNLLMTTNYIEYLDEALIRPGLAV